MSREIKIINVKTREVERRIPLPEDISVTRTWIVMTLINGPVFLNENMFYRTQRPIENMLDGQPFTQVKYIEFTLKSYDNNGAEIEVDHDSFTWRQTKVNPTKDARFKADPYISYVVRKT